MYGGPNFPWQLILSPTSFSIENKNGDVLYRRPTNPPSSSNGAYLKLENTGSLVLYDSNNVKLWGSH